MLHPYLMPDEIILTVIEVTTVRDSPIDEFAVEGSIILETGSKGQAFLLRHQPRRVNELNKARALFLVNADHGADYGQ